MRTIDETYKALALAPSRRIYCRAVFGTKSGGQWTDSRTYRENDYIISASIDIGAKSGGLEIGRAYCAKLTLRLSCGASVSQSDQIKIGVGFLGADGTISKWVQLGVFYVDTVKKSDNIITITAYDRMLRAQKFYNSSLSYPCAMSDILDEICGQMGIATVGGFALPIDPVVLRAPVKGQDSDGNTVLYTRREVLSYIASACAGNFFFNGDGQLDLTDFSAVSENMAAENSITAEISDETFTVSGVTWIDNGISHSRYDEDTSGLMEFENPLPFQSKPPILDFIDGKLTALSYNNATITRQGCGWYEPGDIVTAFRRDGTSAAVLISGINYKIESGGFTEKIYSSALSENQSNYTTGDVTGQQVPQSVSAFSDKSYTTAIHFTATGFDLTFDSSGGRFVNTFTATEDSAGNITKITNETAGRSIDVTYDE